jgi:hypothetical protein
MGPRDARQNFCDIVEIGLRDFYNDGFGWVCRQCERDQSLVRDPDAPSRLLHEGEAEGKNPRLSNRSLARWQDAAQRILVCPRCGITESVEKS